jgi:hypothetical protein
MDEFADPASVDMVTLAQPVALMFRDASDLSQVTDGIEVTVHDSKLPLTKRNLRVVPSGWWTTPRLPGFAGWPSDRDRSFVVEVSDLYGRYLPTRFGFDIGKAPPAVRPGAPGAISPWTNWPGLNAPRTRPIRPDGAPAGYQPDYLPLFPTVARATSGPRAEIRAQLMVLAADKSLRPARWAAMTVQIGTKIVGLGVADAGGALVAAFGYPPYPAQVPSSDPRPAITWPANVSVYFDDLADPQPDLGLILKQLNGTAVTALASVPAVALGPQDLVLGQPLVLRTKLSATETASSLYLKTA